MGADLRYGLATKVDFSEQPFKVWIDDEKLIEAEAVIIATGASAKWLGIESEQRLNGYGVSACAVCDGFFLQGKRSGDCRCRRYSGRRSFVFIKTLQYSSHGDTQSANEGQ